jgi:hypothetical protein
VGEYFYFPGFSDNLFFCLRYRINTFESTFLGKLNLNLFHNQSRVPGLLSNFVEARQQIEVAESTTSTGLGFRASAISLQLFTLE